MSEIKSSRQLKVETSQIPNIKDNIYDIFAYKKQLSSEIRAYESHVRKLTEIRNMRKNSLQATTQRNLQIQHIKDIRHNNFVYKLNQHSQKICDDNLRLFDKISRQSKSNIAVSLKAPLSIKVRKPVDITAQFNKIEKSKQISKQNQRLKQRIKSSEFHINHSKLIIDQKKRQQIRSRIRKFDNNSELKSQRYFSAMSNRQQKSQNLTFSQLNKNQNSVNQSSDITNRKFNNRTNKSQGNKLKIISFYNPKQVLKNKIENFGIKYKNYNSQNNEDKRPGTTAFNTRNRKPTFQQQSRIKHKSFFATEAF